MQRSTDESKKELQDLHPSLPSTKNSEARLKDGTLFSDHVYLLMEFETAPGKKTKVVSANMLGGPEDGAYRPIGGTNQYGTYEETEETITARRKKNAEFISKVTKEQSPDFIALQEISSDLKPFITEKKDDKYLWDSEKSDQLTLFDSSRFQLIKDGKVLNVPSELAGNCRCYTEKGANGNVLVFNLHADFMISIQSKEMLIRAILEKAKKTVPDMPLLFIGDWNSNIGPLDDKPRNITTAIGHTKYHPDKIQGALFPDGGFSAYLDKDTGEYVIKQAQTQALNPVTGTPYTDAEIAPLDTTNMPAEQKREVEKHKIVMCLDDYYKTTKLINGKSVFDYEKELCSSLNDKQIVVRATKTANNASGVGIALSLSDAKLLQTVLGKDAANILQFNPDKDHERNMDIVYVCASKDQTRTLHQAMRLLTITKLIEEIPNAHKDINHFRQRLINVIKSIDTLKHLDTLAEALIKNKNLTVVKPGMFGKSEIDLVSKQKEEIIARFIHLAKMDDNNPFASNEMYKPIHHAAHYSARNVMELILHTKTDKADSAAEYGRTPLAMSIFNHDVESVKLLLEKGANPHHVMVLDPQKGTKQTPFELAMEKAVQQTHGRAQEKFFNDIRIITHLLANPDNIKKIPQNSLFVCSSLLKMLYVDKIEKNKNEDEKNSISKNFIILLNTLDKLDDKQKSILGVDFYADKLDVRETHRPGK